jgi:topoisomerase-4 subunit A
MRAFKLSEVQAEAILNMRLRSLRRLEEMEIKTENDALKAEQAELNALVDSEDKQWDKIGEEIGELKTRFGKGTAIGRRRSQFGEMPEINGEVEQAFIEKEPITVVLSEKGWIRALKGHADDLTKLQFKTGDALLRAVKTTTADKLVLFATNGKFYTLDASALPGGRSQGEPVRLMIDLEEDGEILEIFAQKPGRKLLVASKSGNGFIVAEDDVVASTRKGKQVLNVEAPDRAALCAPAIGDSVAVIGENRKLLVFPLADLPEMARGKGVRLQKYKDGGLADAQVFARGGGVQWADGAGRTRTLADVGEFVGARASAGQSVPKGFPRDGRFGLNTFNGA